MPKKRHVPEPSLATILERIDAQGGKIDGLEAKFVAKFQSLDGRFQSLEAKVDAHGNALQNLAVRVDSQGTALQNLAVRVDSQGLLLEDMRSQNRLTIEAVEASRAALEQRIDRLDQDGRSRDAVLELSIRDLRVGVQQNTVDIRDLAGKVESLARIEGRVSALERRFD